MKLYELTDSFKNISELLENPDFAENQDIIKALESIQCEFNKKAENIVYVIKNTESDIEAIDNEIKRLQEMKTSRKNNNERLKAYLKFNMEATGNNKIRCPYFTIAYRETKESAVELDEKLFLDNNCDESLLNIKITPNKTEIKARLKAGEHIEGAKLVDSKVLTIR